LEGVSILKIKLDENLSRYLKQALQEVGFDVQTTADEGLNGKSDIEVSASARNEGRMIFTLDVEFADLRKYPLGTHPGIVLFRPRTLGAITVNSFVLRFVQSTDLKELDGCVIVVDQNRVRVRCPRKDENKSVEL